MITKQAVVSSFTGIRSHLEDMGGINVTRVKSNIADCRQAGEDYKLTFADLRVKKRIK